MGMWLRRRDASVLRKSASLTKPPPGVVADQVGAEDVAAGARPCEARSAGSTGSEWGSS